MLINLRAHQQELDSDWVGDTAAFTCPECRQVFIVIAVLHKNGRMCPRCQNSAARVVGSRDSNGTAAITWDE
jgi:hypothetical protein